MAEIAIHFVRVTADDRACRLWAAATAREDAVDRVLDIVPEGWSARLLDEDASCADLSHLDLFHLDLLHVQEALSDMTRGDVRELSGIGDAAD